MELVGAGIEADELVAVVADGASAGGGGGLIKLLEVEAGTGRVALVGEDGLRLLESRVTVVGTG